jgi:hypothetical protein
MKARSAWRRLAGVTCAVASRRSLAAERQLKIGGVMAKSAKAAAAAAAAQRNKAWRGGGSGENGVKRRQRGTAAWRRCIAAGMKLLLALRLACGA